MWMRTNPHERSHGMTGAAVLLATLLLATGCMVGPDYKRPDVPLNFAWSGKGDPRLTTQGAADVAWWRTFGDPALDRLIEIAYHQNLPLQVAGLRILEARAQLGLANAALYPHEGGFSASGAAVGLSDHAPNSANIDHHFGDFQVGFDAVWEPDFWGKYRRGVRAAHATWGATVADYDDALVSLSADVARTYVAIRTFEVLVDLAQQNVKVQEEGLQVAQSRFSNGATSGLDVSQATSLLEGTRASVPVLQSGLKQAENALSTLLGRPTGYVHALVGGTRDIPAPPPRVAVGVPAELLRRRPDIRAAELRAIAQCDQIGVAKSELLPQFNLFGMIGFETSAGGGAASNNATLGNLFDPSSLVYNAGAGLLWPILRYPQILNNIRVQDARYQALLVGYVQTVLKAAQEVEDGTTGYLRERDAAASEEKAVAAAQSAVQLSLTQYREGAVDYQRVIDTERVLLDAQNRLTEMRSSAVTSLIALYKALGGGWEVRMADAVVTNATRHEMEKRTNWGGYLSDPPRPAPHEVNGSSNRK
jgi:NodT family efflux transporter outer membrane factor (OMF) lipoprotein